MREGVAKKVTVKMLTEHTAVLEVPRTMLKPDADGLTTIQFKSRSLAPPRARTASLKAAKQTLVELSEDAVWHDGERIPRHAAVLADRLVERSGLKKGEASYFEALESLLDGTFSIDRALALRGVGIVVLGDALAFYVHKEIITESDVRKLLKPSQKSRQILSNFDRQFNALKENTLKTHSARHDLLNQQIRAATESDLPVIQALCQQNFEYHRRYEPTLNMQWTYSPEGVQYFLDRMRKSDGTLLVVTINSQVVGYLSGGIRTIESYRLPEKLSEIESMSVDTNFRLNGLGRSLIQRFKAWSKERDVSRIRVEASARNATALQFYRKRGFQDASVVFEMEI